MASFTEAPCRIQKNPATFRFIQLTQIAAAFEAMNFTNKRLIQLLATNILANSDEELDCSGAADVLHSCAKLGVTNASVYERLVRLPLLPMPERCMWHCQVRVHCWPHIAASLTR